MDGDMVLSNAISQEVVKYALQHVTRPITVNEMISGKETEMLSLAAKGLSNKEIGARLEISEATVKGYFVTLYQKLNVRSRTVAIFVGLKTGILTLDDLS